jgi:hypothetical protein
MDDYGWNYQLVVIESAASELFVEIHLLLDECV